MSRFIQPLESRQLLSATFPIRPMPPVWPISSNIVPEPVHEFAGVSQKVRIGYLPKLNIGHVSQLRAEITWGDGSASPASFDRDKNGGIDIEGTHTYAKPGTFSISSDVIEMPYYSGHGPIPEYVLNLGEVETTATVAPAPAKLTEVAGQQFTAELAKFKAFTLDIIFSSKINWGDGHVTDGTLSGGDLSGGNWVVTGTHTYPKTGTYIVHTDIYSQVAGSHIKPSLFSDFVTIIHVMGKA